MHECGCPMVELYAKAAKERDALVEHMAGMQRELAEAIDKAASWKAAYEIATGRPEERDDSVGLDGPEIEAKEGML